MVLGTIQPLQWLALSLGGLALVSFIASPHVLRARLEHFRAGRPALPWLDRVQLRYRPCHTAVWMFAWFKLRMDPMFRDLPVLLEPLPRPKKILDLGCGYGVAGNSLLEWYPECSIVGIDPDPARVPIAAATFAERGSALQAGAPDFESAALPEQFDTATCLDVIHFVDDADLLLTLQRLRGRLTPGGKLILRSMVPPPGVGSFSWNMQVFVRKVTRSPAHHRSAETIRSIITDAGFTVDQMQPTSTNDELVWFIATA